MSESALQPIITFTANLVAETTYYVNDWGAGKTSRATKERFQVGGKGINVSKMLMRLSRETTAACFPGGDLGDCCRSWLDAEGIPYRAFSQGCDTRSGSIIRAPGKPEISILGLDCRLSREAIEECIAYLSTIPKPYTLAVCGVFPDWESDVWTPFRDWVAERDSDIRLAVDTYGPGLHWFVAQSPNIVKINRDELNTLFPSSDSRAACETLLGEMAAKYECPQWIVTNGEAPIFGRSPDGCIFQFRPRKAEGVSPIGCGDVFFATYLDAMTRGERRMESAVALAAEYASRNAESEGIADFDLQPVPKTD